MKINDEIVGSTLKQLRGYFKNMYLGGSYAASAYMPIEPNDVDVFILGPRMFDAWTLVNILESIFDDVREHEYNASYGYKIPNQFKRIICTNKGIYFDLIFIDCDIDYLVKECTASTLSMFYRKVTYSSSLLEKPRYVPDSFFIDRVVYIDKNKATEEHYNKIVSKAALLGYRIRHTT